ncbi:heme-binding protein [Rhodococcus opacus]|uniref:heme-binding protein n=1 Tax=Rhodococcus opacus TaxID=37919 RepID=UPI00247388E6|nr:heme-binding protein [Rhodococcus opacus]MDH6286216.1 glc operon protein GlcG [Rhodococcus opacus]
MTLTAARAQLALDLARRHAATLDTAVAVSVVDDAGNLMCCSRTDGAAAELLESATRTALGVARRTSGTTDRRGVEPVPGATVDCGMVPAWTPHPADKPSAVGVLAVATSDSGAGARIVETVIDEIHRFDKRHRRNIS